MHKYLQNEVFNDDESIVVRMSTASANSILHTHDFLEIVYVFSGQGKQYVDGKVYDAQVGSMLFINCNETHYFQTDSYMSFMEVFIKSELMSQECVSIENAFSMMLLSSIHSLDIESVFPTPFTNFSGENRMRIQATLLEMLQEYSLHRYGSQEILKNYLNIIFICIQMHILPDNFHFKEMPNAILAYINDHFTEKLSLSDLANKCFYSPKYFSYVFKKTYNVTLSSYIKNKRLEEGLKLLSTTDMSIDKISSLIGWTNSTVFYEFFRKKYGMTPAEFRINQTLNDKNSTNQ